MRVDWWVDERRDPVRATDGAVAYLNELKETFGSVYLAAAAYNGGPGSARRWLAGGALPAETTRYVDWVGNMWRERRQAASPTYEAWLAAGGSVLVEAARRSGVGAGG